jgi:hypothetical protein
MFLDVSTTLSSFFWGFSIIPDDYKVKSTLTLKLFPDFETELLCVYYGTFSQRPLNTSSYRYFPQSEIMIKRLIRLSDLYRVLQLKMFGVVR